MAKKASYRTAIHEAGHAVIGRVLTLSCGHATIKPNRHFGDHVIIEDQYFCAEEWDKRGKLRGNNAGWHAQIIGLMAGGEADRMTGRGRPHLGDGDDRYQIGLILEQFSDDPERIEPRLRAMTRMLVRRHRHTIKRVAKELLAKETVSGSELDRLVGRSLDDIKPSGDGMWLRDLYAELGWYAGPPRARRLAVARRPAGAR